MRGLDRGSGGRIDGDTGRQALGIGLVVETLVRNVAEDRLEIILRDQPVQRTREQPLGDVADRVQHVSDDAEGVRLGIVVVIDRQGRRRKKGNQQSGHNGITQHFHLDPRVTRRR